MDGGYLLADIPPELMQEPYDISVYVCDADGTLHSYFIPVVERPKPESYIYEPVEILRYESLARRIAALEEGGIGGVDFDTTLTQSGKAADAKATGDEIRRVEGLIPSLNGYAKEEDIPTKPEDIGAQPKGNYLTSAPVESVNGKTGAVKLSASDVGALPDTYTPPDQTAEQVGADPAGTALTVVGEHNVDPDSHNDIRGALKALSDRLTAFFDSDDQTLDELSEIVAYIKSNKSLIDAITTSKVSVADIVDNLTTNVANRPLSAAQGVAIKALIDGLASGKLDASRLQEAVDEALAQAKESGEFDGEDGDPGQAATIEITGATALAYGAAPTVTEASGSTAQARKYIVGIPAGRPGETPVRGVDYDTLEDRAEIEAYIATELAKRGQLKPEFASSIEECTDTSKLYVLPDGYIYAYMLTTVESGPSYTNMLPQAINADGTPYVGANGEKGYKPGYRLNSSAAEVASASNCCTGFIPAKNTDTIRFKNIAPGSSANGYIHFYDKNFALIGGKMYEFWTSELYEFTPASATDLNSQNANVGSAMAYFRISSGTISADTIITVNEEIVEGGATTEEYAWVNTGHAFVPADYEPRIITLERQTATNTAEIQLLKKGVIDTDGVDALDWMQDWDTPIYDAHIPVFRLSAEKAAMTDATMTPDALYAMYDALMAQYPHYITKTDLGVCSDGVNHVYRYDFREPEQRHTSNRRSETKAKAILLSGIHLEWAGIFGLYYALEEITTNPELRALRRNVHLIVIPCANPYVTLAEHYDQHGGQQNANGVEIHRNFPAQFLYPDDPGYVSPGELHHGGTEPLSEPETQYIDQVLRENKDAAFFMTCHNFNFDAEYGVSFLWPSTATAYMCNMGYRWIDRMSQDWIDRFGDELAPGIAAYRTDALESWDTRLGYAQISGSPGTETKQAASYGIQATNPEIAERFWVHGTPENKEPLMSAFSMSRGCEALCNHILMCFGTYDPKDKREYFVGGESGYPVYGYVDGTTKAVVLLNAPEGDYTYYYEMEDGSLVEIGKPIEDNNTYHSITNNLTNCTSSNSATQAVEGGNYEATITANSGYELSSITVTMGGVDVSATAVAGGTISIEAVTGDVTITAVAVEAVEGSAYTNLIPISTNADGSLFVGPNGEAGYKPNTRVRISNGEEYTATGIEATGFFPVKYKQTLYIKGITIAHSTSVTTEGICFYSSSREFICGAVMAAAFGNTAGEVASCRVDNTLVNGITADADIAYARMSAAIIGPDSVVTADEPLE